MESTEPPILSVLVPTYNNAHFIGEALDSVHAQGVPGVEIIVVDDGSTDNTPEVLRPWVDTSTIRFFSQANRGPSSARNLALQQAQGRYIMLLDADDLLYPGSIRATLDFLERNKDVDFFFCNYDIFDESGLLKASGVDICKAFRSIPHREVGPAEWVFHESLAPWIIQYGSFMHTSGLTLRREAVERVGPFLDGYFYAEDDEFYARLTYSCTSGYLDRVYSRKRNHAASLTHSVSNKSRNVQHLLELSEIQRRTYHDHHRIQRILRAKIRDCASIHIWGLLEQGSQDEARALLKKYLHRYPLHFPFYRLLVRSLSPMHIAKARSESIKP